MTVWQAPPAWSGDTPISQTNLNKLSTNESYLKEVIAGTNTNKVPNAALASGIDGNKLSGGTVHDGAIADVGANKVGWGYPSSYIQGDNGLNGSKLVGSSVTGDKLATSSVTGDKLATQVEGGEVYGWSIHQGALLVMTANFSRAFSSTPFATATIKSFSTGYLKQFSVCVSATTTTITISVNNDGTNDATVTVDWIAVGPS